MFNTSNVTWTPLSFSLSFCLWTSASRLSAWLFFSTGLSCCHVIGWIRHLYEQTIGVFFTFYPNMAPCVFLAKSKEVLLWRWVHLSSVELFLSTVTPSCFAPFNIYYTIYWFKFTVGLEVLMDPCGRCCFGWNFLNRLVKTRFCVDLHDLFSPHIVCSTHVFAVAGVRHGKHWSPYLNKSVVIRMAGCWRLWFVGLWENASLRTDWFTERIYFV